jgi:serine/threonine-protein kinase
MEPVNESPQNPRVLGNRYEVGDLLGRGGMAEVHLGRDTRLGRVVAIKLLRTDLARDPMFQARFRREAQSAAGLNHPAIVAVYDTGEETVIESGGSSVALPYIVMEYVEGRTLRDVLRDGRPLEVAQALEVTGGVLSALDYSHRMGIVHRDIKPANVMLTASGDVKVMDFGIARALADVSATMTQTQAVIGTAQYLSPEQARGETVDARSDLYSAGCLLFELMTCRPPFVADSPVAVAYQHVRELPQAPSAFNPAIPEVVDRIVLHALAKDREARYQTAAEFRSDVEAAGAGRAVAAAASTVALTAPQQVAGAPAGPAAHVGQPGQPGQPGSGATTEYIAQPAPGSTRAMPPIGHTMPQAPVGPGGPGGPGVGGPGGQAVDDGLYARRRSGGGAGNRRAGFIALAVAVVAVFAAAAYGVSYLVGQNSAANAPVTVPKLVGLTQAQAAAQLKAVNLSGEVSTEASTDVRKGVVIRTDPISGRSVKVGSVVKVIVSSGADTIKVPNVSGQPVDQARTSLTAAGLTVNEITEVVDGNGIEKGLVVGTDPAAGQDATRGAQVTLQISSGKITIPNVVGKSQGDAVAALKKAGYNGSILIVTTPSDKPANQVIDQDPTPGPKTSVPEVKLFVAVPNQSQPTDGNQGNGSDSPSDTGQGNNNGNGNGSDQGNNNQGNDQNPDQTSKSS